MERRAIVLLGDSDGRWYAFATEQAVAWIHVRDDRLRDKQPLEILDPDDVRVGDVIDEVYRSKKDWDLFFKNRR